MRFEWDENKNLENIEKHKISFEIAQEAFFDEKRLIVKEKNTQKKKTGFSVLEMMVMV